MTMKITDWMTKSSSGTRSVARFGLVGEDDASQDDCFRLPAHLGKNCLAYNLQVFFKDLQFRNVMLQIKAENLEQWHPRSTTVSLTPDVQHCAASACVGWMIIWYC